MITLIGNGGHAKVIRDLLTLVVAAPPEASDYPSFIIAVGDNRARLRESSAIHDISFATLIHPSATVSAQSAIGPGSVVMAGAVVQADVTIGKHCIINTCASVDHDCVVGDFVHIAPGCRLCGSVTVGEGAFLGAGCIVVPGAVVEPWTEHKAGSIIK